MNILDVLATQRKGRALIEGQSKLQELVKICNETGKAGTLTIKLKITPTEENTLVVSDDIDAKLPKPAKTGSVFYFDEQGALYREDPKQPEFAEVTRMDGSAAS